MSKPHKHAELIKAWADGAEIEYYEHGWHDCAKGAIWDENVAYRIKPPAPKWPETTMEAEHFGELGLGHFSYTDSKRLANAAIAHALETGQVVLPLSTSESKRMVPSLNALHHWAQLASLDSFNIDKALLRVAEHAIANALKEGHVVLAKEGGVWAGYSEIINKKHEIGF